MKNKRKFKSIMEQEMEDPEYRKAFEEGWPAFQLEVQILNALERKHWSYSDLAKVLHTQKSAISRDLKNGGIRSASISRIAKMAQALDLEFLPLCVSEKVFKKVLPIIKRAIALPERPHHHNKAA